MRRSIQAIAAMILIVVPALSARAADVCQPILRAMDRLATTPAHIYSTETAAYRGSKAANSETIYTDGAIYVKLHGRWIRSRMTPRDMLEQQQENRRSGKATCTRLRDDVVTNTPASVFRTHEKTSDETVDTQIWIAKSSGLLLREDIDIDVGGSMGKSHRSNRYEYVNVHPPLAEER